MHLFAAAALEQRPGQKEKHENRDEKHVFVNKPRNVVGYGPYELPLPIDADQRSR
jgi:hypothetical protein